MTKAIVARLKITSSEIEYIIVTSDGYYAGVGKDLVTFVSTTQHVNELMMKGPEISSIQQVLFSGKSTTPATVIDIPALQNLARQKGADFIYLWVPIEKVLFAKNLLDKSGTGLNNPDVQDMFDLAKNNGGIWLCKQNSILADWYFTKSRSIVDAFLRKIHVSEFLKQHTTEILQVDTFYQVCYKSINLPKALSNTFAYLSNVGLEEVWKQYVRDTFGAVQYDQAIGPTMQPREVTSYAQTLQQVAVLMEACTTYTKEYITDWLQKLTSVEIFLKERLALL